jgi:FkbM family methyltransferase
MKQSSAKSNQSEQHLVWDFFQHRPQGVFVEVGANHPTRENQTWFLEQQGWTGVLVEPNPDLFRLLLNQRPHSRSVQAAVGAQDGEAELFLGENDLHSTLAPVLDDPLSGKTVRVKLRTLNSILTEASVTAVDFLSIDVEGMELQVLQGLDLEKFSPQLILLEEHRRDYTKHFYLRRHGYRLVRRTGRNNWYVPPRSLATMRSLNTSAEVFRLWRKMWLNPPFNKLKRTIRNTFRKRHT